MSISTDRATQRVDVVQVVDGSVSPVASNTEANSNSEDQAIIDEHPSTPAVPDSPPQFGPFPPHMVPDLPQATKSLSQLAEERVINQLREALNGYQSTASYCCGGRVPISLDPSQGVNLCVGTSGSPRTAPPIALRWDVPNEDSTSRKIYLPIGFTGSKDISTAKNTTEIFDALLKACSPATFGHNGEDVLDENYRKAGKLDRENFSVDFHPHDYGIVDAISQTLLPEIGSTILKHREEHRGVVAELYKLNVYSGPAGKFEAHVDTPRGEGQFGSLVVCLPHPHEGGQLRVTHKGHSTFFDWSNTEGPSIEWAAFYSDCEHEVLPVKTGHRITLTYNLFITEQVGSILGGHPSADPTLFPLFEGVKQMLEQPGFMKNGGTLAYYCSHAYAHSRRRTSKLMPWALKGTDMALYAVFHSLGLKIEAKPMLEPTHQVFEKLADSREFMRQYSGKAEDEDSDPEAEWQLRVGTEFHDLVLSNTGGSDESHHQTEGNLRRCWPQDKRDNDKVTWLNAPGKGEVALVNLRYGNDASLNYYYSHAVIFIEIPKQSQRTIAT